MIEKLHQIVLELNLHKKIRRSFNNHAQYLSLAYLQVIRWLTVKRSKC